MVVKFNQLKHVQWDYLKVDTASRINGWNVTLNGGLSQPLKGWTFGIWKAELKKERYQSLY